MRRRSWFYACVRALWVGLGALAIGASTARADYVTTSVAPSAVATSLGSTGAQPLSVLATQDLTGTSTDLALAQRYTPSIFGYQAVFSFTLPSDLDVGSASGLALAANFYGQPRSAQRWTFQVRDFSASSWLTLGYNDGVTYHQWTPLTFTLSGDFSRFVNAAGVMQIRFTTYSSMDWCDLDLLVFRVTRYVPPTANHQIPVGRGYSDVSPHQLVRTSGGVLYTVTPDCSAYPDCPNNAVHVMKADQAGTPTSFTELDAAHAPGGGVGQPAVALDGQDRIHVIWSKRSGYTKYAAFDTVTGLWSSAESLGSSGWTDFGQGEEGTALAVDASGVPHAVWSTRTGPNARLRLKYARRLASGWEAPVDVADVVDCNPASDYCNAWHPALAFAPNGDLQLAWLNGTYDYVGDGRIRVRTRLASGAWQPSVVIPDAAQTGIDQGPSMIVSADGVAHLAFLDTANRIRYWYRDANGWNGNAQPPTQVTHNPSLGPDGAGGVYLYGHGTPQGSIGGFGPNLYSYRKPLGGSWGAWTLYVSGAVDSSVTTRWSQFFHHYPQLVDVAYWGNDYPNQLYVGVN